MYKKYKGLSDDEIVLMYKTKGEDDLENELFSRYKIHTRKLSGDLYRKFKFLYQVEFDDIHCITTACIFLAVNKFKPGMRNFFKYWRNVAVSEVYNYVGQFSSLEKHDDTGYESTNNGEQRNYFRMMKSNDTSLLDEYSIISDIASVIEKDKNNFDPIDKDVFYLFIEGYSLYEIAELLNLKYSAVRRRVSKIKQKITDILFNQ